MCLPGQPGNHNHNCQPVPFISHSIPLSSRPTTSPLDCCDRSTSHRGLTERGFFAPLHPATKPMQVNHCYQTPVKLFAADCVLCRVSGNTDKEQTVQADMGASKESQTDRATRNEHEQEARNNQQQERHHRTMRPSARKKWSRVAAKDGSCSETSVPCLRSAGSAFKSIGFRVGCGVSIVL